MDEVFPGIERRGLAHGAQIFLGVLASHAKRIDREAGADCERRLVGRRAFGGGDRSFGEGGRWRDPFWGQRSAAGDASSPWPSICRSSPVGTSAAVTIAV